MSKLFLTQTPKNRKILEAYQELRSKMKEAERLLAELIEHPEFDDAMAASPEFKELREAAQARRAHVVELELLMADRGLHQAGFKYVGAKK